MPNNRLDRINEELKKEVSNIINYDLKNPNIKGMITVTKVNITPDLRYAKLQISMLNVKDKKENLKQLKTSSGYIRSEIAKRINLRYTPELVFELDESIEYGAHISEVLNRIMPKKGI